MSETVINSYADALVAIVAAEGGAGEVEDELFRFARAVEGNEQLSDTLSDPHIPAERRAQIVEDLLGGKAAAATTSLASLVVANGRVGNLTAIVDRFVERSAGSRGELVAEVRSAVALTEDQKTRLDDALRAARGAEVTVRNIVDPSVVGGVVTQVGDTLLDGSVRTRLSQLRDAF